MFMKNIIKLNRGQLGTGTVETGASLNVARRLSSEFESFAEKTVLELEGSVTTKIDMLTPVFFFS